MSGSVGELARGALQKKVASPAHSLPAICLAFSMCSNTADESGLAGTGLGACARTHPAKIIASVTAVEGYVWGRIVSVPTSDHRFYPQEFASANVNRKDMLMRWTEQTSE
jgi:hypothetical protein